MEETKNNGLMKNLKYIFILIGVVALLLAYFLVFSGYSAKADDLDDEIDSLKEQYSALQDKAELYNEDKVKSYVEDCDKQYNDIMKEFDGGISYESQIMDTYNMTKALDIQIPSLTMSPVTDIAGDETAERPDITFLTNMQYVEKTMSYQINTVTEYDKMKDVIKYVLEYEGKRKVPTSISFSYDATAQKVALSFSINEYAIAGEDRAVSEVEIPPYAQGSTNIFYNEAVKLG